MIHFKNKMYTIEEFFSLVKNKEERSENYNPKFNYSIYTKAESLQLGDEIYIGDPVDFDENDNEIFPEFTLKNGLFYYCSDENIQDVIDQAFSRVKEVSDEDLLKRLEYYLEKDTFLD